MRISLDIIPLLLLLLFHLLLLFIKQLEMNRKQQSVLKLLTELFLIIITISLHFLTFVMIETNMYTHTHTIYNNTKIKSHLKNNRYFALCTIQHTVDIVFIFDVKKKPSTNRDVSDYRQRLRKILSKLNLMLFK